LNVVEPNNTKLGIGEWESELWSLINIGDGVYCPLQDTCQNGDNPNICLNKNEDYSKALHEFLDSDHLITPPFTDFPKFPMCSVNSKLFMLVTELAKKYVKRIDPRLLPVPWVSDQEICSGRPVEIREVPLKYAHGAVWSLKDAWVIHLNSRDSSARKRFTLYHEIFHVLAHCNATPIFKKPNQPGGSFNEMLADFFSGMMVLPEDKLREKWGEIGDIKQIATIFDVPETVMYCGLKWIKLI
jgi:hypothetical protein